MENNLLEYIKNHKEHPLNKYLNISDDNKYIISRFDKKKKSIYGEKKSLEELGREIYSYMDSRINDFANNYNIEFNTGDNNFADLTNISKNLLNNIVEFKIIGSDNNKIVEEAKIQIQNYIEEIVKNKKIISQETFATIIIMDVEKLVKNPILIDQYYNSIDDNIKINASQSLKKFGIHLLTLKYDIKNQCFIDSDRYKAFVIPVTEKFNFPKTSVDIINDSLIGGKAIFTRNAIDAKKTITSTPNFGISNVRIRFNPLESNSKRNLVLDVMETINKGFYNKDKNCLNKHSDLKTFVFLKEHTIKNFLGEDTLIITTTSGATINGQQSTEIPSLIKEFLSSSEKEKSYLKKELEQKLVDLKTEIVCASSNDKEEFYSFMEQLSFNYSIIEVNTLEEAQDIAYSKNNSIPLKENEKLFSQNSSKFRYLSNHCHENLNILLSYPNVRKLFTNEENVIDIEIILFLINLMDKTLKQKHKSNLMLLSSLKPNSKIKFDKKIIQIIDTYIIKKSTIIENSKLKKLRTKLKENEEQIKYNKTNLKDKESKLIKTKTIEVKNYILEEIDTIEKTIASLNEIKNELETKIKNEELKYISEYELSSDSKDLILYIDKTFKLWKAINSYLDEKLNKESIYFIRKQVDGHLWALFILFLVLKAFNFKNLTKFKSVDEIKLISSSKLIINSMIEELLPYDFTLTLNNASEDDLKKMVAEHKSDQSIIKLIELFEKITLKTE